MLDTFTLLSQNFIKDYNGHKLIVITAGAGSLLHSLSAFPGSSKCFLGSINIYDSELFVETVGTKPKSFASYEATDLLLQAVEEDDYQGALVVSITGALTATRHRKGKDRAYAVLKDVELKSTISLEFEFPYLDEEAYAKLTPEQVTQHRLTQEEFIAKVVLKYAAKMRPDTWMYKYIMYEVPK